MIRLSLLVAVLLSATVSAQGPQLMAADCVHLNYPGHFVALNDPSDAATMTQLAGQWGRDEP